MANIATQEVFAHTDALVEIWDIGAEAAARTLVKKGDRFGVTLTNTSDISGNVGSKTYGRVTVSLAKQGGVGNSKAAAIDATQAAGVAVDGTWEFEGITGVTTSTAQSTEIYITDAGALTTTKDSNTFVGVVNYPATYTKAAGVAPVKIGA